MVIHGPSVALNVEADVSELLLAFSCGYRMAAAASKQGKGMKGAIAKLPLFSTWLPGPCFSSL